MRMPHRRALCSAFLIAAGVLAAAPRPATAQELDCREPRTQSDMNECARRDFEAADRELNRVYGEVRTLLRQRDAELGERLGGIETALVAGQRGWIAYRDGHCTVMGAEARGGTMEPLLVASCMAELTRSRTGELAEIRDGARR